MGVFLSQEQAGYLAIYRDELLAWNCKINITAITDPSEIAVKHFVDSLIPGPLIAEGDSVLDIGSGGGFPGIPLAILLPSIRMTLMDSNRKRANFQRQIIRLLKLKNVCVGEGRAESFHRHPDYANSYDIVISRAFSALSPFVQIAIPFLGNRGKILAMKGSVSIEECECAIQGVPLSPEKQPVVHNLLRYRIISYILPVFNVRRSIVVFER
jgi:16S rRNA (guanine527-N7)-methyltransferase